MSLTKGRNLQVFYVGGKTKEKLLHHVNIKQKWNGKKMAFKNRVICREIKEGLFILPEAIRDVSNVKKVTKIIHIAKKSSFFVFLKRLHIR